MYLKQKNMALAALSIGRRPFNPVRLQEFINTTLPGLVRAKGHFWLATRPDWVGDFSLAGAVSRTTPMGRWWVAVPRTRWPDHPEWKRMLEDNWSAIWGDRRQELVFIGIQMDEQAIRTALDHCLIEDVATFVPEKYRDMPDPFPRWG